MAFLREVIRNVPSFTSRMACFNSSRTYQSIPEFYKGKSVLVTGCTGFLGQGLVEKLLRSCPEIGNIYVSIKPNKYGDTEQRYRQLLQREVFEELGNQTPNFDRRVIPFDGDLTQDTIGLSKDFYNRIVDEVEVIFHCAALIKLNPSLRESVDANILASRNVFQLGQKCRKLCAYIQVSTMFSNMQLNHIEETIYPTLIGPNELIDLVKNQDDTYLRKHESRIIKPSPMVYIFCKKAAENILTEEKTNVPSAVFRSPYLAPSLHEPFPIWTYGYAGYCGILYSFQNGTFRHLAGKPDNPIEMLPVDLVVNSLISTGWYLGTGKHKDTVPLVVNVTSSTDNPVTLRELGKYTNGQGHHTGDEELKIVSNRTVYAFLIITHYLIPSLCKDFITSLRGGHPTHVKNYLRLRKGLKYNEKATFHSPTIDFKNAKLIYNLLNDDDKKRFAFNVQNIKWEDFVRNWIQRLRNPRVTATSNKKSEYKKENDSLEVKRDVSLKQ